MQLVTVSVLAPEALSSWSRVLISQIGFVAEEAVNPKNEEKTLFLSWYSKAVNDKKQYSLFAIFVLKIQFWLH